MRISDWSSDVCSSDLREILGRAHLDQARRGAFERSGHALACIQPGRRRIRAAHQVDVAVVEFVDQGDETTRGIVAAGVHHRDPAERSEEHTSELQSLMRISYAVFCLKKKKKNR